MAATMSETRAQKLLRELMSDLDPTVFLPPTVLPKWEQRIEEALAKELTALVIEHPLSSLGVDVHGH